MLFRRDTKPLADDEDRAWFEMQAMGRRRYIVRRTALALSYTILPLAVPYSYFWWGLPAAREYLVDDSIWISLPIGTVLVGSIAAAHAWVTWRSYELRDQIEDVMTPMERAGVSMDRSAQYAFRAAILSSIVLGLGVFGHMPWWAISIFGLLAFVGWRAVFVVRRARKRIQRLQDTLKQVTGKVT